MKQAVAVIDLQFGSTGKGLLAGTLAHTWKPDLCVHANYPNAGHTFQKDGRKWVFRMTANSFVAPQCKIMLIGPGAVIDLECLRDELAQNDDLLRGKRVIIHPAATILKPEHSESERKHVNIGSTMKGSSAAIIDKISRDPSKKVLAGQLPFDVLDALKDVAVGVTISREDYYAAIDRAERVMIEGAQGHSLSVHSRFHPYCTSRDVSVHQLLADCGIPRIDKTELIVAGAMRTFPIRVANRFDKDGNQIGTSGPCYPDQKELDWKADLGREPELTTVTKLPRRIFTLSDVQIKEACEVNRPDFIFLSFCDYVDRNPGMGLLPTPVRQLRDRVSGVAQCPVRMLSWGPDFTDVYAAVDGQQYAVDEHIFKWHSW